MQYQLQFLDAGNGVVRETRADAGSAANAFLLVTDVGWPPLAVKVRVLDPYRRVLSVSKPKGQILRPSAANRSAPDP